MGFIVHVYFRMTLKSCGRVYFAAINALVTFSDSPVLETFMAKFLSERVAFLVTLPDKKSFGFVN